jgi:hypothetical protein
LQSEEDEEDLDNAGYNELDISQDKVEDQVNFEESSKLLNSEESQSF